MVQEQLDPRKDLARRRLNLQAPKPGRDLPQKASLIKSRPRRASPKNLRHRMSHLILREVLKLPVKFRPP